MIPKSEISALLNLIEDPDEQIFSQVKEKLISFGTDIIPEIEIAWEKNQFGDDYQKKLENIIHEIQFKDLYNSLKNWKSDGAKNLLDGVILVNKFQYPSLDRKKIEEQIDTIVQDAKIEISEHMTGIEKVTILNELIYAIHGFQGNKDDYYSPSNSFLSDVLETKKGNALLLAIIYLEIATRLNIPIKGVNLPNHFILGYLDTNNEISHRNQVNILFYINAFSNGEILSINEIKEFLEKINLELIPEYFLPCTNEAIVKRLITNLVYSHKKLDIEYKLEELELLLAIF